MNQNEGDYYNAIRLYELFEANNIKEAWIYDEKFIAGFLLTFGYDYFIWYTQLKTETRVSATFFFDTHKGKRQAIARHLLTRLYKLVKMTINDGEDKYAMTKFVFDNPAKINITINMEIMVPLPRH